VTVFHGEGGFDSGRVVDTGKTEQRHVSLELITGHRFDGIKLAHGEALGAQGEDSETFRCEAFVVLHNRFLVARSDRATLEKNAGASVKDSFEGTLHHDKDKRFALGRGADVSHGHSLDTRVESVLDDNFVLINVGSVNEVFVFLGVAGKMSAAVTNLVGKDLKSDFGSISVSLPALFLVAVTFLAADALDSGRATQRRTEGEVSEGVGKTVDVDDGTFA